MNSHSRSLRFLIVSLTLGLAVWLGARFVTAGGKVLARAQKIGAIMNLIQQTYVEEPDLDRLTEGAVDGMLKRLDPHSIYIPAKEQKTLAERDEGEFQGIGISFMLQNELITVVTPIAGTPSDRLGIRAGDKIIEIDGVSAFGIKEDEVFQKLRGPKGTSVKLRIARDGVSEPLDFTVIRDDIPIHSILASFMLDDSTGYLLLGQFSATTSDELETTLRRLERLGMKRLIFDLRNNGGGRMNEAVLAADMFIPGGFTLVSRKSRRSEDDSTYCSHDEGTHPYCDLIILLNGGSASASEIVASAMQDLDRGMVVGQRSFGKGLVQSSYPLRDGGALRISTAHWFAPSGRMVQVPYDRGRGEYYAVRYRNQGLDAPEKDRLPFYTLSGRTVYGSSGVYPDSLIDDIKITNATAQAIGAQVMINYSNKLAKKSGLTGHSDFKQFLHEWKPSDDDLNRLTELAKQKDVSLPDDSLKKDRAYIEALLKANVAQLVWNDRDAYYQVMVISDPLVAAARTLFPKARKIASRWAPSQ